MFAKFNLKIFYPPAYKREIWHYNKINTDLIDRSIHEFSWESRFPNTVANQKVCLFSETMLRSAISKVKVIFNYFEDFRAFRIS